jgi:phage baseplate assembly protein W
MRNFFEAEPRRIRPTEIKQKRGSKLLEPRFCLVHNLIQHSLEQALDRHLTASTARAIIRCESRS